MENIRKDKIKMIKSKVKVNSTENLSIFNFMEGRNRAINKPHLRNLIKHISRKNLLRYFPIVVNGDMDVFDGQHRVRAAEKLKSPIWYIIAKDEDMDIDDIPLFNGVHRSWTAKEFLEKYISLENENYIKFKNILEEQKIFSITQMLNILSSGIKATKREFNNGEFEYPADDAPARKLIQQIRDFSPYFVSINHNPFVRSIIYLSRIAKYDHTRMLNKLSQNPKLLYKVSDADSYFVLFNQIYNYRTSKEENEVYLKPKTQKGRSNDPKDYADANVA